MADGTLPPRPDVDVVTFGCRLNAYESEQVRDRAAADGIVNAVVFNTCAVRENADNRLYGNLGHLLPVKNGHPGMQIAVGGCLAQKDRSAITDRAPWVDVVFGTHNIGSLPVLLERARVQRKAQVEILESLERFPSVLPARRESPYSAWVAISVPWSQVTDRRSWAGRVRIRLVMALRTDSAPWPLGSFKRMT